MEKQQLNGFSKVFVWGIACLGLGIIIIFLCRSPFNDWSGESNAVLFGQYGDFIGGFVGTLFALVGFILLYQTLRAQREALDTQKKDSEKQSFENTFFNLLNVQQNITNQIKVEVPVLSGYKYDGKSAVYEGRAFFQFAKEELTKIFNSFESENHPGFYDVRQEQSDDRDIENANNPANGIAFPEQERVRRINIITRERKIQFALEIYNINSAKWQELKNANEQERMKGVFKCFFEKYGYTFGHYFRHLYNIIKFVRQYQNTQLKTLTHKAGRLFLDETNPYVKFIQAQMSSYELMLLYYNAFCFEKCYEQLDHYKFLDNLPEEDLVYPWHNFEGALHLQNRADLLDGV